MSAIFDLLYREYCRARLGEMRKQLLLSVANNDISAANWMPAILPALMIGVASWATTSRRKKPRPSGNRVS
jgi:hypothetical protein